MRYIVTLILLSSFVSLAFCQTKEEALHDAKIRQEARAELLLELKEKEKQQKIITIDANKTRVIIKNFVKLLETKFQTIQENVEKEITDPKKTGIVVTKNTINIDINTSKNYLNELEKKMQTFVKEFDNMAKEFNIPLN